MKKTICWWFHFKFYNNDGKQQYFCLEYSYITDKKTISECNKDISLAISKVEKKLYTNDLIPNYVTINDCYKIHHEFI